MTLQLHHRIIRTLAARRVTRLARALADPMAAQEGVLRRLVRCAARTEFGRAHGFASIRSVADFRPRVRLASDEELQPALARVVADAPAVQSVPPGVVRAADDPGLAVPSA